MTTDIKVTWELEKKTLRRVLALGALMGLISRSPATYGEKEMLIKEAYQFADLMLLESEKFKDK